MPGAAPTGRVKVSGRRFQWPASERTMLMRRINGSGGKNGVLGAPGARCRPNVEGGRVGLKEARAGYQCRPNRPQTQ